MATGGYGIFRGLNEGYNSYREREREIEDKDRRLQEDQYRKTQMAREEEEYEYGVSRRAFQEKNAQIAQEAAQTGLDQAKLEAEEWRNNKQYRADINKYNLANAEANLKNANISYDMNELKLRGQQEATKYRGWLDSFMEGGTMETLVDQFNNDTIEVTDKDGNTKTIKNTDNDIANVVGNEEDGWEVEFENGRVEKFADRDAVSMHIERMADPQFNQTYLMQKMADKQALNLAAAEALQTLPEDMLKFQKEWSDITKEQVDRGLGTSFKEGLVEFGTPGSSSVANAVSSIVSQVGAMGQGKGYTSFQAQEVVNRTLEYARTMIEFDPQKLRARGEEAMERMDVDQLRALSGMALADGKPDEGDDGYDDLLGHVVFADRKQQIDNLRQRVLTDYWAYNPDTGGANPRANAGSKGEGGEGNQIAAPTRDEPATDENTEAQYFPDIDVKTPVTQGQMGRGSAQDAREQNRIDQGVKKMTQDKREKYGIKTDRRGRPKKVTASQKQKINADFKSFLEMPVEQQQKWYDTYGKHLTTDNKQVARNVINQATAESPNYGLL